MAWGGDWWGDWFGRWQGSEDAGRPGDGSWYSRFYGNWFGRWYAQTVADSERPGPSASTAVFGMCCGCGNSDGPPTYRDICPVTCDAVTYLDCQVPEVWRMSGATVTWVPGVSFAPCANGDPINFNSYLYLNYTGCSGGFSPSWAGCSVLTCPDCNFNICGPFLPPTGVPASSDALNQWSLYPLCSGSLFGTDCDGISDEYVLTEPCMVLELQVEDGVPVVTAYYVCPLSAFSCNGANVFTYATSRVGCYYTDPPTNSILAPSVDLPAVISILPTGTPACVSAFVVPP